jgi:hypothetical protein
MKFHNASIPTTEYHVCQTSTMWANDHIGWAMQCDCVIQGLVAVKFFNDWECNLEAMQEFIMVQDSSRVSFLQHHCHVAKTLPLLSGVERTL